MLQLSLYNAAQKPLLGTVDWNLFLPEASSPQSSTISTTVNCDFPLPKAPMSILSKSMDSGGTASAEYPEPTAASVFPPTIAERNEATMREVALVQELATRISDDDLRTILTRPSEERANTGTITNVDFLSRFVPHYFKGHQVYKDVAIRALELAVDTAILNRIEEKAP